MLSNIALQCEQIISTNCKLPVKSIPRTSDILSIRLDANCIEYSSISFAVFKKQILFARKSIDRYKISASVGITLVSKFSFIKL